LEKAVGKEEFTRQLRTEEGDGYMSLILEELEKTRDFVDVLHVAKAVAEKLHVEPVAALSVLGAVLRRTCLTAVASALGRVICSSTSAKRLLDFVQELHDVTLFV